MMPFFQQIFTLLANAPGNLVYHLALVFSVAGALQEGIAQWRSTGYPQTRRMVTGLGVLLVLQALQFLASGLAWQGAWHVETFLPPADRAVMALSLVWALWMWTFPEPARTGDAGAALLSLLLLLGLGTSLVLPVETDFNLSVTHLGWNIALLTVAVLGGVLLIWRKPQGWSSGLSLALLVALGVGLDFAFPSAGDYSGLVRLFFMAAFPLLLTLPARFPAPVRGGQTETVSRFQHKVAESAKANLPSQPLRERRRYSTDPKTLTSLITLAAEVDAGRINQNIARSVAQAMLADLCFVIYIGEDKNTLFIASGYDLIREEFVDGGLMNKDAVPMLSGAILRGRPLRLPASTTSSDLKGLGELFGLPNAGNLLNVPISGEKGHIGSVLLLSPYSNRAWNADDQTFLTSIATSFVPIIERSRRIAEVEHERERALQAAEEARSMAERLQGINNNLNNEVEAFKNQAAQFSQAEAARQEALREIQSLRQELEHFKARPQGGDTASPSSEYLESELRLTLQEVARLQNALADANIKILEMEKRPSGHISHDQAEVIASIAQELRQPMSSIIGYTDLMLGESVGILGALQRKFVERIKSSTERIGSLIDDLIQITTLETGLMLLKPEAVDLNLVIDNAMAYTSSQLREKNIALRIDLPETLQSVEADRDALQQILIHLLQNAGAVSPAEGAVTLRVRTERENNQDYVSFQVSDSGGGIPAEDLTRVFSRLYRADNALIQGVGDTGVGLSIAKSLTEAQGGRIWVESQAGEGATFSVLLPVRQTETQEA